MDFYFLDEQEGLIEGDKFTAICGVVLQANCIDQIRSEFFPWFLSELRSKGADTSRMSFRDIPVLHGCSLLPEFDDALKVKATRKLLTTAVDFGAKFIRLGYYNSSIPMIGGGRYGRINFCITNLLIALGTQRDAPFAFVSEIDKEALKKTLEGIDRNHSGYYAGISGLSEEEITIDFKRFIGHYFAAKHDVGCQIADLSGYIALKAETAESQFARELSTVFENLKGDYLVNDIIRMKSYSGAL